ncbi:MAG: GTP cyclohydrolase FolE2 [Pseudomonadota bacterium]
MNVILPDISQSESAPHLRPLEWVGMQGIDLPITLVEAEYRRDLHARADLQVDLPVPHVKGIHMSRLYRLLDKGLASGEILSPSSVYDLLRGMIETHTDCGSESARLRMAFDLLLRRPALITEGLAGWKSYPIAIEAKLVRDEFKLNLCATIEYSSTCPCSAALSRQLIEKGFVEAFAEKSSVDVDTVSSWLRDNASLATPHSQRSKANVSVNIDDKETTDLGLIALIDCVENAVGTPVQTAVKRADEQAFAALNGQNLMFVEDAARRIEVALADFKSLKVNVRHMESLHPHDAVAWSMPAGEE